MPDSHLNGKEESIHFFVPFDDSFMQEAERNLEKASKGEDLDPYSWKIGGIISTTDKDLDGEYIDPAAFDTTYFLQNGWYNDDHQRGTPHKVGIPTKAYMTEKGLYTEGYLLKDVPAARGIYNLMKTLAKGKHNRRVGFSVEGKILEQEGNVIKKVFLKDVALTANPVNTKTYAELLKSMREEKKVSVLPNPDLKKDESVSEASPKTSPKDDSPEVKKTSPEKSSSENVPLKEIKEHVKVDKAHFKKIAKLASEIAEESKNLMAEDKEEFDKALAAGNATGNTGPSGPQTNGQALRVESLDDNLKVTTNDGYDKDLIKYTMKKSLINDEETAIKILKYAELLKQKSESK